MAVAAEAVIPHPLIVDAVVDVDIPSRTLAVRLSELEQGGNRRLWKDAYQALKASREAGWLGSHPTLYASTPTARNVVWGTAGDFQSLLFSFPAGVSAFAELIGKPRLVARVALDRSSRHFISVRLFHRP